MVRLLASLSFLLTASAAMSVTVSVSMSPARCDLINGSANATASGGIPPYSYSWSNGALGPSIAALAPGDYTVTVTDGLGNTAQATGTVFAVFEMGNMGMPMQFQPDCQGQCIGMAITAAPVGGTQPYNYPPGIFENLGQLTIMGLCAGMPAVFTITDANGCPGTVDATGAVMAVDPAVVTVQGTTPACEGQSNGSMTIVLDGPAASLVSVTRIGGGYSQDHYPQWGVPYTINSMPAGDYDLISTIPGGGGTPLCTAPYSGSVPEIAAPCGGVSGRVYHDADQGCTYGGFDLAIPNKVLEITPGPSYAISAWDGTYTRGMVFGNFAIGQVLDNETQVCPPANPEVFTLDAGAPQAVIDFANVSNAPHDLSVSMSGSAARPGFPTQVWITIANNSPFPSGDVTIDLSFDPLLLNPSPVSGQWSVGVIPPFGWETRSFTALVPANINLLGTVMNYTATVINTASEVNTVNNTTALDVTITGSYDPNDKQGHTSSALSPSQYFLVQDEWIDYTIRFQNTGTAAAETVTIRDTIDTDLFIPSLEILGASHAFTPSFGFEDPRELVFTFDNIDLPDSTSDLLGSQGFISFRLKPNDDIIVGDVLENTAGIHFDFNPPIITNTVTHVVDFSTAMRSRHRVQLHLQPNPVSDQLLISADGIIDAIAIITADGREVLRRSVRASQATIDIYALTSGTYVLEALMNDGTIARERVIKH